GIGLKERFCRGRGVSPDLVTRLGTAFRDGAADPGTELDVAAVASPFPRAREHPVHGHWVGGAGGPIRSYPRLEGVPVAGLTIGLASFALTFSFPEARTRFFLSRSREQHAEKAAERTDKIGTNSCRLRIGCRTRYTTSLGFHGSPFHRGCGSEAMVSE